MVQIGKRKKFTKNKTKCLSAIFNEVLAFNLPNCKKDELD